MDSLQGQLKDGFSVSCLSKITQKSISQHSEDKSDWADILQKHAYGQSTGTVN